MTSFGKPATKLFQMRYGGVYIEFPVDDSIIETLDFVVDLLRWFMVIMKKKKGVVKE